MRRGTVIGGFVWTVLAVGSASDLFRLGLIELLFLLAPLVVVPLGLDLAERLSKGRSDGVLIKLPGWMCFPAALCATASFWLEPGIGALTLVLPWFCLGCWLGFSALLSIVRGQITSLKAACVTIAFLYLPIGCGWLVASRGGFAPMGFQEPIVLLTAVHFHFAGFAAPIMTLATAGTLEKATILKQRVLYIVAAGVLAGPGLLAAGFVIGPHTKLAAALLVAGSEFGLAMFFLLAVSAMRPRSAQALVVLSATSVIAAMILAGIWAIGEFPLQPFVNIADMAEFHGVANALGFSVCGLLGWTLSTRRAAQKEGAQ
ncbi:MAG TPA: YndJ family transporter [Terriglobales bacterium]|nr:YndJ family transporter [Terriglobales bacterium]